MPTKSKPGLLVASTSQGSGEIEAAKHSIAMAKKWAESTVEMLKTAEERLNDAARQFREAKNQADIANEQVKEAEEYLKSIKRRKWEVINQSTHHQHLLSTTMLLELDEEHTTCFICKTKFSTDIDSK